MLCLQCFFSRAAAGLSVASPLIRTGLPLAGFPLLSLLLMFTSTFTPRNKIVHHFYLRQQVTRKKKVTGQATRNNNQE
jgi:hypothetical protein